jgi:hypothetical protein
MEAMGAIALVARSHGVVQSVPSLVDLRDLRLGFHIGKGAIEKWRVLGRRALGNRGGSFRGHKVPSQA